MVTAPFKLDRKTKNYLVYLPVARDTSDSPSMLGSLYVHQDKISGDPEIVEVSVRATTTTKKGKG